MLSQERKRISCLLYFLYILDEDAESVKKKTTCLLGLCSLTRNHLL
jgi:hypothetical protein